MGYPSPGVLTASIDSGIAVKSIWDVISGQVFNFARAARTARSRSPKELKGKSIALGSSGWKVIVDPMLVELGIDPKSVQLRRRRRLVDAGGRDRQGRRRARLGRAPRTARRAGPEAQVPDRDDVVEAPVERVLRAGRPTSRTTAKKDLYTRFLQGVVMGLEFTKANPRAAAQITYRSLRDLQKTLKPQLAARLDARARARVRHEPPEGPGLGLQRREGLGELPEDRPRPRPDEEAPDAGRRLHERAAGRGEQEGGPREGDRATRRRTSSTRTSRRRRSHPASRCKSIPRAGRSFRVRPGALARTEARCRTPLAGHTNSYHTYSHDEALQGIAAAGYRAVELSAVPGLDGARRPRRRPGRAPAPARRLRARAGQPRGALRPHDSRTASSTASRPCAGPRSSGSRSSTPPSAAISRPTRTRPRSSPTSVRWPTRPSAAGIKIGLEIHGDIMASGAVTLPLLEKIGRDSVGINYDTANVDLLLRRHAPSTTCRRSSTSSSTSTSRRRRAARATGTSARSAAATSTSAGVLEILRDAGYDGPYSVEIEFQGEPWPPLDEVTEAMRALARAPATRWGLQ